MKLSNIIFLESCNTTRHKTIGEIFRKFDEILMENYLIILICKI